MSTPERNVQSMRTTELDVALACLDYASAARASGAELFAAKFLRPSELEAVRAERADAAAELEDHMWEVFCSRLEELDNGR